MKRSELAGLIAQRLSPRHVVICGMGATTFSWQALRCPAPTYYSADPMGLGAGLALGFAVTRPDAEVVFLAGDGDLIMNLSVLLAWSDAAPNNLRMIVFHNRRYETGGGQQIPGADRLKLDAVAAAMGIGSVTVIGDDSQQEPEATLDEFLRAPAPAMLVVEIAIEPAAYPDLADVSGAEDRAEFQRQLRISLDADTTAP
jgi:thiamine pyrophosphate-dependent acetolactate synthase large subunit-like protein